VWGSHAGSGWGVYGMTPNGIGVHGNSSAAGYGVFANSNSGTGLFATSTNGIPLTASVSNNANNSPAITATTLGAGPAIQASSAAGKTALDIGGGLRMRDVNGSGTPAFVHSVVPCGGNNYSAIDNVFANGSANAILLVTHSGGAALNVPIGVVYNAGAIAGCPANRWLLRSESGGALPAGATFNVLVIMP